MSEITKLYENAGIKPIDFAELGAIDFTGTIEIKGKRYFDFTPEKQLSLIKWLVQTRPIHITFLIDKWVIEGMVRYGKRYDTFEDALSGYFNNIWQDLTESDQKEIADILKG